MFYFFEDVQLKNTLDFQLDRIARVGPGSDDQGAEEALLLLGSCVLSSFPTHGGSAGWVRVLAPGFLSAP